MAYRHGLFFESSLLLGSNNQVDLEVTCHRQISNRCHWRQCFYERLCPSLFNTIPIQWIVGWLLDETLSGIESGQSHGIRIDYQSGHDLGFPLDGGFRGQTLVVSE